ncbi:MAG: hypothetical protein K2Q03_09555 [Sphingobacteriaceae bacterium]|nr:hypothetical protein [Sphingobacteriaceae bacterium]
MYEYKNAFGIFIFVFFLSASTFKVCSIVSQTTDSSAVVKKQVSKTILKSENAVEDSWMFQDENEPEIEEDEIGDSFLHVGGFSFSYFLLPFKERKKETLVSHKKTVTAELYTLYCNWKLYSF